LGVGPGIGEATLLSVGFIRWIGFDFVSGAITRGESSAAGTHIVYADTGSLVDVQVFDAGHIVVHNADTCGVTVTVTLTW
jgi:hypothetical protein